MLKPYQQRQHLPIAAAQGNPLIGTLGTIAGTTIGGAMGGPAGAAAGGALGSQLGNVVSGAEINPTQMAVTGLTSGMTAGSNAAKAATADMLEAKDAVTTAFEKAGGTAAGEAAYNTDAYKSALEKLKTAGSKAMEAENSMFNDPFGKAGAAIKSGYNSVFMSQGGEVNPNEERKKRLAMLSPMMAALTSGNPLQAVSPLAAVALSEGGKAKGPLCGECEAQYKACGGMTKKY